MESAHYKIILINEDGPFLAQIRGRGGGGASALHFVVVAVHVCSAAV